MHRTGSRADRGFSMIEAVVAMGLLTVGLLSLAAVFTKSLALTSSAGADIIAKDKAFEAIESLLAARDAKLIVWADVNNTGNGGKFVSGYQPVYNPGADGIIGTADDSGGALETIASPGPDQELGTSDDVQRSLGDYERQISITNDSVSTTTLRRIKVDVRYGTGGMKKTYTVETLITSFGVGQ